MSAFVVSKRHVDAMVWAAERYTPGYCKPFNFYWGETRYVMEQSEIGRMLWGENVKSVAHRYDEPQENLPGPKGGVKPEGYEYEKPSKEWSVVEMLKMVHGYEYQTCEHPGWTKSQAHAFCQALKDVLECALPGYEEAETWAI